MGAASLQGTKYLQIDEVIDYAFGELVLPVSRAERGVVRQSEPPNRRTRGVGFSLSVQSSRWSI
jgi:hypothetical protein